MGIAVASDRMGFAYLIDGELMDWKLSFGATRNVDTAFAQACKWLGFYEVHVVVLEDPDDSRRGHHTQDLLEAIRRAAETVAVSAVCAPARRGVANKYEDANLLAEEFPQLAAWLPDKRRLWEHEPRNIILFEALSQAWRWWRTHANGGEGVETIEW